MTKFILSIDGGGIRGIIPSIILTEIERRTNKRISEIFDLIAGTSTGGLLAAYLCKKVKEGETPTAAQDMLEIYRKEGPYIFSSNFFGRTRSWVYGVPYSHKKISKVLDKYFGITTMAEASTNLMMTSYDVRNDCPYFFKSWSKGRNHVLMKDALRATTAAPTYFRPHELRINNVNMVLMDGGVFANNPAACAYASAKQLFKADDYVCLSLGTGRKRKALELSKAKKLGKIGWLKPIVYILFSASLDVVNFQLDQIMGNKYIRLQTPIDTSAEMDNVEPEAIQYLESTGHNMVKRQSVIIDKFCEMVS